ncbi:Nucleoside-diphosphate-sugar epimerase [[Clostridium] aminophilum]|uniref:Nucleoside-diphosphate-sugar epimerase n=1 Tax=[Clostridium] aminophilum TaxID=1526 RepID=A0A1I0FTS2_9FIRM|nr:NAD-dependent epimerase/dehydratase family protein [[Clostridium] aminophilum]SET61768.1 Nucleoside-diphosphate-sugar epimerase [[Clostridium] aminophilum]
MNVLFIGGNGNISWWCVQEALEAGWEVYELNRGQTRKTRRAVQPQVHQIIADIHDTDASEKALGDLTFDCVCDFICFNGEQARERIGLFKDRTSQYIVISSEAVYQRKSEYLPFTETTPKYEPDISDGYISGKLEVEKVFQDEFTGSGFPVTIVRPGFTYDTIIQVPVGQNCFTAPQLFREGYPLLMPGDGENLVAPLHSKDFARAFWRLIGNRETIGESYHIVADKLITWNEMAREILKALGTDDKNILHISRENALRWNSLGSEVLNRQHMWHYIFDNSKIREIAPDWKQEIPFSEGIRMTVDWLMENEVRRRINPNCKEALLRIYREAGVADENGEAL